MPTRPDVIGDLVGLRRAIEASPVDAVLAVSPENVRYAGNVHISTQRSIRDRLALIVWAKGRDPVFVLCAVEEGYVRQTSWIGEIRAYKEFVTSPMTLVADVLREWGLDRGRLGVEADYLAVRHHDELVQALPGLRTAPCDELFARVRMRKTPMERALLRQAFRATERAMLSTYLTAQAGETERRLAERLAEAILHSGADEVAFNHINAGPNTGFPHMTPGGYRVRAGDIIKADSGGFYQQYQSNIGRTAKMGPPTAEDRSYWSRLREIHHRIIDLARPGNTGRDLFEAAVRLHAEAGIPFPFAHNGHSIGLQVHERPLISPHEDIAYEAGMVTTVETRVRWVGKVGYHMEDLVEITDGAPVVHSTAFDNEEILEI